jgi:alanine racemase
LGVDWFGVSNLEEALSLRSHGVAKPILNFGITPPQYAGLLAEKNITQTIHSLEYARALDGVGVTIDAHIKLDTGMSRLGFVLHSKDTSNVLDDVAAACACGNVRASGVYTHFSCADEPDGDSAQFTRGQFLLFMRALELLGERGITFPVRHCCNSAAAICCPEMHLDMVRPGIVLYGLNPSRDLAGKLDIKPVMGLYSCVSMVKEIDEGAFVSYGRRYTAHRRMKVATVPIGYADGYERELSNKARMLVRGRIANVIGRVCMDQLMLDVTHIDGVREGDTVTIVGTDGKHTLTFDEMADLCGTINYEKVSLLGKRVPRIYRQGGEDVGMVGLVHYI